MKVKRLPAEVNALERRLEAMDANLRAIIEDEDGLVWHDGERVFNVTHGSDDYNGTDWGEVLKVDEEVLE